MGYSLRASRCKLSPKSLFYWEGEERHLLVRQLFVRQLTGGGGGGGLEGAQD